MTIQIHVTMCTSLCECFLYVFLCVMHVYVCIWGFFFFFATMVTHTYVFLILFFKLGNFSFCHLINSILSPSLCNSSNIAFIFVLLFRSNQFQHLKLTVKCVSSFVFLIPFPFSFWGVCVGFWTDVLLYIYMVNMYNLRNVKRSPVLTGYYSKTVWY